MFVVTVHTTDNVHYHCLYVLCFSLSEVLDYRHLLLLAKRIAADWDQLAKLLSVAEEEIDELLTNEGRSYQGAFRMLWEWREASSDLHTSLQSLLDALRQLGRSDAVEQILC